MNPPPGETMQFQQCASIVRRLSELLLRLESSASLLQLAPLAGREWHDLLRQKLLPQLGDGSWLVVAVVGGTNIGKSVVFNHLAGSRASASSPLASGTKHPVCLVPDEFPAGERLQSIFPDFQLHEWNQASDALTDATDDMIFWRRSAELPNSLLILDTPDIDSDAKINWKRADSIRRCADVLIAVLTQQKYNDAAVKEFFRRAGAEDKAVIVVFNQCLLPEDEQYWPIWLRTFCDETKISPVALYVTPADRRAAENLQLPFFRRQWPISSAPGSPSVTPSVDSDEPQHPAADLSRLRFHEIRLRTLRGSLRELIHPEHGIPSWLQELTTASRDLASTAERLSVDTAFRIRDWPSLPNSVMVDEIRIWWQARQHGWARQVNSLYNTLGAGILWPIRAARNAIQGEPVSPLEDYRHREWTTILTVVEELFSRLQWIADSGTPVIRTRIQDILKGASRSELLTRLKSAHQGLDFAQELRFVVDREMQRFRDDSPDLFTLYRQLHNVSAVVRPMTSVVLFSMGFGPAGEAVAPFVAGAAAQAVVHVVADVAGGATVALAGDAAVANAAGTGAGLLQAWFHRLHAAFTARRATWLTQIVHTELLGTLPEELRTAASLLEQADFKAVTDAVDQLNRLTETFGRVDQVPTGHSPTDENNHG